MKFNIIPTLFLLCFAVIAHAQTPAQNKETSRIILSAVDAGDLNTFSKYVSPQVVEHMQAPPGVTRPASDLEFSKMMIAGFHAGLPDSKTNVIHMTAEGDIVMIFSEYTGTNTGSFMGMPATNKPVKIEQVDIIRFDKAGKAVEHWAVVDQLTMMMQLGMIPSDQK